MFAAPLSEAKRAPLTAAQLQGGGGESWLAARGNVQQPIGGVVDEPLPAAGGGPGGAGRRMLAGRREEASEALTA